MFRSFVANPCAPGSFTGNLWFLEAPAKIGKASGWVQLSLLFGFWTYISPRPAKEESTSMTVPSKLWKQVRLRIALHWGIQTTLHESPNCNRTNSQSCCCRNAVIFVKCWLAVNSSLGACAQPTGGALTKGDELPILHEDLSYCRMVSRDIMMLRRAKAYAVACCSWSCTRHVRHCFGSDLAIQQMNAS